MTWNGRWSWSASSIGDGIPSRLQIIDRGKLHPTVTVLCGMLTADPRTITSPCAWLLLSTILARSRPGAIWKAEGSLWRTVEIPPSEALDERVLV